MTILVTGGTGYIGSHTCVELLNRGLDVVIADNLVNSSLESMKRGQAITGKTPVFYDLDVRDEEKLSRVFEEHHIDCAIHFAGLKAVGGERGKACALLRQQSELHHHPLPGHGEVRRQAHHLLLLRHRLLR